MNRIVALCSLGLTACGGLTPLGSFTDTDFGTEDTGIIDSGTDDIDLGTDPIVTDGVAPRLVNISAADLGSQISVAFTATDVDNDLSGGAFELTVNGATTVYDIPGSLSTWDGSSGAGTIRFPKPTVGGGTGCGGGTSTLSIRGLVEDNTGLRSGQQSTTLQVSGGSGGGVPIPENGDGLDNVFDAGVLQVPCTLSGDIYVTGGGAGYGDLDVVAFAVATSGTGLNLSWAGTGDYDVYLYDSLGFTFLTIFEGDLTLAPPIAAGDQSGSVAESVNYPLTPGEPYYLLIGGWEGPAGTYTLTVR
jgi:hypothetical protein